MATVQENKEIIIKGFSSMQTNIADLKANLETNYIDTEKFTPVAKAAFQDYPKWEQKKSYKTGDMICVKNRKGTQLPAKCLKDFTSATDTSSMETGWEVDVQLGNIQLTPVLGSTVGGPVWGMMKGYTLDAWEIEGLLNNAYVRMGELSDLQTNSKETIVSAINEIKNSAGSGSCSGGGASIQGIGSMDNSMGGHLVYIGAQPTNAEYSTSSLVLSNSSFHAGGLTDCLIIGYQGNFQSWSEHKGQLLVVGQNCSGDVRDMYGDDYRLIVSNGDYQDVFKVTSTGTVYCNGSVNANGADYAEYFEWEDGNTEKENRTGLFVSLHKNKIRIAKSQNEYIVGIVSTNPSIVGNNGEDRHTNKWGIVGLLGQIPVKDNGLCVPGEMCSVENGIAIPGNKYYVMERLDNNTIKILFK